MTTERAIPALALRDAVDHLIGRAQDMGLVRLIGTIGTGSLLVTSTLAKPERSRGPLPVPSLVATVSPRDPDGPRTVALLDDGTPAAPVLLAAEVSHDRAISHVGPQDEDDHLPLPHVSILTDSVRIARPKPVDDFAAEVIHQRVLDAMRANLE